MFTLTQGIDLTPAQTEEGETFSLMDGKIRVADYSAGNGSQYQHRMTNPTYPNVYMESGRCNVVCMNDGVELRVAHVVLTMSTGRTVLVTPDDLEQHFEHIEG